MARRVPRRPPEVAAAEHQREAFGGAERGRSSVPLPVSRDSKTLARLRSGAANRLETVRAYQDTFTLAGGAETVELTYLPLTFSEHVYLNGIYQREGDDYDWTRPSGTRSVVIDAAMDSRAGDILTVEYLYYAGVSAPPTDSTPANASYVAAGTRDFSFTTVSPGLPAGVQDGDLLVLQLVAGADTAAGATFSGLGGWTLRGTATSTNDDQTRYATTAVYTRTYNSGTYATPSIGASNLESSGLDVGGFAGAIHAWRDASIGAVATWASTASGPFSTGGVTTTANGSLVAVCVGVADDTQVFNWTAAGLTGFTERFDQDAGGFNVCIAMASGTRATAGATGTISFESLGEAAAAIILEVR